MKTAIKQFNDFNTQRLTILVAGAVLVSVSFYVYFINLTVVNGTKFETLTENISNLESEISEQEVLIVDSTRNIDKLLAQEVGFGPLKDVVYIKTVSKTALNGNAN
jgi:hypothetical protein